MLYGVKDGLVDPKAKLSKLNFNHIALNTGHHTIT